VIVECLDTSLADTVRKSQEGVEWNQWSQLFETIGWGGLGMWKDAEVKAYLEVMEMELLGRKPPGRSKKTGLNLDKEDVFDRDEWRALIKCQTQLSEEEDAKRKKQIR